MRAVVGNPATRSGATPKSSVKSEVLSSPNDTAVRVPTRLISCGANSEVSAIPSGYAMKITPSNVAVMPRLSAHVEKKEERKVAMP